LTNIEIRKLTMMDPRGNLLLPCLADLGNCGTEECVKGDNRAGGTVPKWKGDR
jgi:hypothetical protein